MYKVASNKTIVGVGSNAVVTGGGLNLSGVSNIIIRNIKFTGANDDSINVQESSHHIWIDHCDFTNGYDGLLDIKRQSSYITVSWNHFYAHEKTCLLGHSDDHTADIGYLKVTYHHNFFDGTGTRHPRIRFGQVHVYNNYYLNNEYGVASTMNADVLVEGNYFQGVDDPCLVGYADSAAGDLVQRNNVFNNCGSSPQTQGSVAAFPYSVTVESASNIPNTVRNGAGVGKI
jgi:pectate lyase